MTDLTTTDSRQPDPAAARADDAPNAAQRQPPAPSLTAPQLARGLTLLALATALGLGGSALWIGQQQINVNADQAEQLAAFTADATRQRRLFDTALDRRAAELNQQLTDRLNQTQTRWEAHPTDLDNTQNTLSARQDDIQTALTHIQAIANRGSDAWVLAEAQYLMRIANHRWQLQHDVDTAIIALQAADERLRTLANPSLTPIRQQLVADINTLRALPNPDIEGLSASLSSIANQAMTFPLPGHARLPAHSAPHNPPDTAEPPADTDLWERLLTRLSNSIELRRRHDQVMPLLSPEAAFNLRQNVQLKLESARLHLLRRNAPQLRADLDAARTWLDQYFRRDHPAPQAAQRELTRIAGIDIALPTADITASLRLLRTHLAAAGARHPKPPNRPPETISP